MPIWWMWVNAGFLRISDALVCGGDGFPHALLHGVSHAAGLRPAVTLMRLFVGREAFPMHDCMGFHMLRVSDPRLLRCACLWGRWLPPCIAAWGFACCGSPTRGYSDAFVCGGGGIPMHCCMGFRMLRVSDPRHSDALVLWGRFSPCIAAWGFACCGSPTRGYSDGLVLWGRWSPTRGAPTRLFCGGFVIFAGNNEFVI